MTGLYVTDAIRVHYEKKKKKGILTKWMVNSYLIIQAFLVFCIFMCSYFNRTSNLLFKSIKLSSTEKLRCFHILKFISILLKAPNIQGMFVCQKSPAARIFVFLSFFCEQTAVQTVAKNAHCQRHWISSFIFKYFTCIHTRITLTLKTVVRSRV